MGDVYCNNCGHKNPIGSNFCSSCGAILETQSADNTTITFHPTSPVDPLDQAEPGVGDDLGDDEAGEADLATFPGTAPAGQTAGSGASGESGVLVVMRGQNAGSRFVLTRAVTTAGRHPDSDIFLDDVTVSRRHAEVVSSADGVVVRDVGSLNGTYINRERIDEAPLAHGDELQIGKFKLVFLLGADS